MSLPGLTPGPALLTVLELVLPRNRSRPSLHLATTAALAACSLKAAGGEDDCASPFI